MAQEQERNRAATEERSNTAAQDESAVDVASAKPKRGRKRKDDADDLVPLKPGTVTLTTPKQGLRRGIVTKQIREMIGQEGAEKAALKLLELMDSADERVALQAATMVIERLYGKARQEIDINADNTLRVLMGNDNPTDYSG